MILLYNYIVITFNNLLQYVKYTYIVVEGLLFLMPKKK